MTLLLSVVVPTRDRAALLPGLFEAFARQDAPEGSFEVLVVDNGSRDGTAGLLEASAYPWLRALGEPSPGASSARNAGVAAARGERVLFLDDDMLPEPDVLRLHAQAHEREPVRSHLGFIDFRWEAQPHPLSRYVAETSSAELFPAAGSEPSFFQYYTAHVSTPRKALLDVGGFDEKFAGYGYEDAELGYRLDRAGVPLAYLPAARVVNREPHDPKTYWRKTEAAGEAQARCFQLHPELTILDRATRHFDRMGPIWSLYRRGCGLLLDTLAAAAVGPEEALPQWVRWHYRISTSAFRHRGWSRYLRRARGEAELPPAGRPKGLR